MKKGLESSNLSSNNIRGSKKELIMLEAKHRSAAKESEETVKMLNEDISRLRSELESLRMKKKEQIVHDQEMSKATWELP